LKQEGCGEATGTIEIRGFCDDASGARYVSGTEIYFDLLMLCIFRFPFGPNM
jgi:hypothetical protein